MKSKVYYDENIDEIFIVEAIGTRLVATGSFEWIQYFNDLQFSVYLYLWQPNVFYLGDL